MADLVTHTIHASQVPADLTNFPSLGDTSDWYAVVAFQSTVANGGGDIRVFQGGAELAREVVSYDSSTGAGEVWFLIPFLSSSTDTVLTIKGDGSSRNYAVTATYGRNAVWSDYLIVQHFADATTAANSAGDSDFDIGAVGTGASQVADAPWGSSGTSVDLDGTSNGTLSTTSNAGVKGVTTDPITVQSWGYLDSLGSDEQGLVIAPGSTNSGLRLFFDNNDTVSGDANTFVFQSDEVRSRIDSTGPNSATTGAWYMLHGVNEESVENSTYLNGTQKYTTTAADTSPNDNVGDWVFGGTLGYVSSNWDGRIREFRYQKRRLADSWITTEYNNQSSPSTFYTATAVGGGGTTIDAVVEDVTGALSGSHGVSSDLAATTADATASFTGTQVHTGDLATTLDAVIGALQGTHSVSGDLAAPLDPAEAAFTGTHDNGVDGDIAATLADATGALTAAHGTSGDLGATLDEVVAALSGSQGIRGDFATSLTDATAALQGTHDSGVAGDITTVLADAAGAFTADHGAAGDLAAAIADAVAVFSGTAGTTADIATVLEDATGAFGGAFGGTTLQTTLDDVTADFTGDHGTAAGLSTTLAGVTASFTLTHVPPVTGDITTTLADATASFTGETAQAPAGDFSVTLEDVQVTLQGSYGVTGDLGASVDSAIAAFAGTHVPPVSGDIATTLADAAGAFTGTHVTATGGSIQTTLDPATAAFTGTFPFIGDLDTTLEDFAGAFSEKQPSIGFAPYPGAISITARTGYISITNRAGVTVFRG